MADGSLSSTGATRVHAASHIVRKRTWDETLDAEKYLKDTDKVGGGSTARYIHIGMVMLQVLRHT